MTHSESPEREGERPPPKRDRPMLWAVGGAVVLFIVIVAAALMIRNEPREEGAPRPSPKGAVARPKAAEKDPVVAFNAALRRQLRRIKDAEDWLDEQEVRWEEAPEAAKAMRELAGVVADLSAGFGEVHGIAARLPLAAEERDPLVRWLDAARGLYAGMSEAIAQTAESGGATEEAAAILQRGPTPAVYVRERDRFEECFNGGLDERLEALGVDVDLLDKVLLSAEDIPMVIDVELPDGERDVIPGYWITP